MSAEREELMAWGQTMVLCDCHEAYTLRGMEAPDCLWHQGAYLVLDELLDSDWLAKVKREAAAEAWWEGVNDQWKHRPVGNRVLETDNPHRKQEK